MRALCWGHRPDQTGIGGNSPTQASEIMNALAAQTTISKQALESDRVREGLKDVLLGPAELCEALRAKAGKPPVWWRSRSLGVVQRRGGGRAQHDGAMWA